MFSKNLIRLRISAGLSQEQFADQLGISQSTLSRLESGVIWPKEKHLKCIAEKFEITIATFFNSDFSQANLLHPSKTKKECPNDLRAKKIRGGRWQPIAEHTPPSQSPSVL